MDHPGSSSKGSFAIFDETTLNDIDANPFQTPKHNRHSILSSLYDDCYRNDDDDDSKYSSGSSSYDTVDEPSSEFVIDGNFRVSSLPSVDCNFDSARDYAFVVDLDDDNLVQYSGLNTFSETRPFEPIANGFVNFGYDADAGFEDDRVFMAYLKAETNDRYRAFPKRLSPVEEDDAWDQKTGIETRREQHSSEAVLQQPTVPVAVLRRRSSNPSRTRDIWHIHTTIDQDGTIRGIQQKKRQLTRWEKLIINLRPSSWRLPEWHRPFRNIAHNLRLMRRLITPLDRRFWKFYLLAFPLAMLLQGMMAFVLAKAIEEWGDYISSMQIDHDNEVMGMLSPPKQV